MSETICDLDGCDRLAVKRGWCNKHYKRWLRHGSPTTLIRCSPDESVVDRFSRRLTPADSGCIEWQGPTNGGYGRITIDGRRVLAHRLAWELHNGPVPHGLLVCHHCDNPRCCNVDHLFVGTIQDNIADRNRKGRTAAGVRAGRYVHGRYVGKSAKYPRSAAA